MQLRDYQREAIDALFRWWNDKPKLWPAMVLPTGAGKTIIFSNLLKELFQVAPHARILVLAHRKELVSQAAKKLRKVWPQAPIGVFSAALKSRELSSITIASRGTFKNALDYCGTFDLVIVDEAHNISPKDDSEYQVIFDRLKQRKPDLQVVGFTATPYRMSSGPIYGKGQIFAAKAYEVKLKYLIDQGYLCRVVAKPVDQSGVIDTTKIKSSSGDFVLRQLDKEAREQSLVEAAIDEWETEAHNKGRKCTIFFCVSVAHAEMVSAELARRGFEVPVIHANTPDDERDTKIAAAEAGQLTGLATVGVLTEGTDIPIVDCIAMLRPTRSLGLYLQMVGRGLRLHPGKQNCLLLDFGGCLERFGPIDIAQPEKKRAGGGDKRTKICEVETCQAVNGFHRRKCCECGFEFLPQPVKACPICEEPNAPSASTCIACDHLFVDHSRTAASGAVLSDDNELRRINVSDVSARIIQSKTEGSYLMIIYHSEQYDYATRSVYLGARGLAGLQAIDDWKEITRDGCPMPSDLFGAMRLINSGNALRKPAAVIVNPSESAKLVKDVIY